MDDISMGAFSGQTMSDRKYEIGQGYGMTRTVKVHRMRPPVHTLRVIARISPSESWASVKVERWNGEMWHQVVGMGSGELEPAPRYVKGNPKSRENCDSWLDEAGNAALALALEVL